MLQERWPPWKAGLYDSEMVSLWGRYFQTDGLVYNKLLQSKFYLKIIDILYQIENTNTLINFSIIEAIIKNIHIFNNVNITFIPQIIKISSKLDIVII